MATFLEDMASYLQQKGYGNIYLDFMPEEPSECIALFLWFHSVGQVNYGSGTRYVQIQVRTSNPDDAYMTASRLVTHLDSGPNEEPIYLTQDRIVIIRPRTFPKKLREDKDNGSVFYFEVSLFGDNTP